MTLYIATSVNRVTETDPEFFGGSSPCVLDTRLRAYVGTPAGMLQHLKHHLTQEPVGLEDALLSYICECLIIQPVPNEYDQLLEDLYKADHHLELLAWQCLPTWNEAKQLDLMEVGRIHRDLQMLRSNIQHQKQILASRIGRSLVKFNVNAPATLHGQPLNPLELEDLVSYAAKLLGEYAEYPMVQEYPLERLDIPGLEKARREHELFHEDAMRDEDPGEALDVIPPKIIPIDLSPLNLSTEELQLVVAEANANGTVCEINPQGLVNLAYTPTYVR